MIRKKDEKGPKDERRETRAERGGGGRKYIPRSTENVLQKKGTSTMKLFIGSVSRRVTEKELWNAFESCGLVELGSIGAMPILPEGKSSGEKP